MSIENIASRARMVLSAGNSEALAVAAAGSAGEIAAGIGPARGAIAHGRELIAPIAQSEGRIGTMGQAAAGELDEALHYLELVQRRIDHPHPLGPNTMLAPMRADATHAAFSVNAAMELLPGGSPTTGRLFELGTSQLPQLRRELAAASTMDELRALAPRMTELADELRGVQRSSLDEFAPHLHDADAHLKPTLWRSIAAGGAAHDLELAARASATKGLVSETRAHSLQAYSESMLGAAATNASNASRGVPHDYATMVSARVPADIVRKLS